MFQVIEGQYFQDLMAQPAALEATLAGLAQEGRWRAVERFVRAQSWRRIVLTGMGSSYHSLHPLNLTLIDAGVSSLMIETSELVHYGLPLCDEQTLVIALSQSGASAETLRLLDGKGRSRVLGITNSAHSRLAEAADVTVLTEAGPEFSVSCKTYAAGLLALQWLAAIFAGEPEGRTLRRLAPSATLVVRYLESWREYTEALASSLQGTRHLFLIGRGRSLAAVGTGALILKESAHFHAEGMSSAAFRHGPMEMLRQDISTMVFNGEERTSELNRRLARELIAKGQRCEEIGTEAACAPLRLPKCDPLLQPIVEILPVQMMTLALAGLTGREAGRFELASKITDTE
jgi:glutamine---fructose-6-phosphate transaminase (isomerizing)